MNSYTKLLCLSLLLSAPLALHSMDRHHIVGNDIVENYQGKDLSATMAVSEVNAATHRALAKITEQCAQIRTEQNALAELYQGTIITEDNRVLCVDPERSIIEIQDELADIDFKLQERYSRLAKEYARLQTSLFEKQPLEVAMQYIDSSATQTTAQDEQKKITSLWSYVWPFNG